MDLVDLIPFHSERVSLTEREKQRSAEREAESRQGQSLPIWGSGLDSHRQRMGGAKTTIETRLVNTN